MEVEPSDPLLDTSDGNDCGWVDHLQLVEGDATLAAALDTSLSVTTGRDTDWGVNA